MVLNTMEQYRKVQEIWKWSKKLREITESDDLDLVKNNLLEECYSVCAAPLPSFEEQCFFPSIATKTIAKEELQFNGEKFTLLELLDHILKNVKKLNKKNIIKVIIMLNDLALYKAFNLIKDASYVGLYSQLNMCIILDTMKIKPDDNDDVSLLLKEVSDKFGLNMEQFDSLTIWAVAMLNYKMHVYDTAVLFFERFLKLVEGNDNVDIIKRKIHARIYIGYCYEKTNSQKGFKDAIDLFEDLLDELNNNSNFENIITELHHGLGHFYNEKAIFGNSSDESDDIINARMHMRMALNQKVDYYSCYGSLFHEYGDYENAQSIFAEATKNDIIKNNDELISEMKFYEGQTYSALADSQDKQIELAKNKLKEFEEYCKSTYNFDGIVHARIFRIRTSLRRVDFGINNTNNRRKNRELINTWYKELTEYTLSNYASKSIKEEYKKTIYILNVFRTLYADNKFVWHMEDILYYLKNFIDLMPDDACKLDYIEDVKDDAEKIVSNLYQIDIEGLRVWCASNEKIDSSQFKIDGLNLRDVIPVEDKEKAHYCIQRNGKPDMVVLILPSEKDLKFEQEIETIMSVVTESYFLFSQETSTVYDINWLKTVTQGKRYTLYYTDSINSMMRLAYCCRALEILRRELLQPIPLFSLAPTHFSSSYDFQLGEDIEIQLEVFNEQVDFGAQRKLCEQLRFVDNKYSSSLMGRRLVRDALEALKEICCKNEGFFVACFPEPGIDDDENYISYLIQDSSCFPPGTFVHEMNDGMTYTIKALPSYTKLFWDVVGIINEFAGECDVNGECAVCYKTILTENSNISIHCRKLLSVILGNKFEDLKYPYKCILRKLERLEKNKDYIYIVLIQNEVFNNKINNVNKTGKECVDMKSNPTVFVTYAWEPEGTEFEKYQKEVLEFTNVLRDHGYDATFDLAAENMGNWTQVMVDGLKREKIIVLLSPEYKRKADETADTGVAIERNALVERGKEDPNSIIFAKLPSQTNRKPKEIVPNIFGGAVVIDLSKNNVSDGYNMLYTRLNGDKVVDLHPVSGTPPKTIKL